LRQVPLPPTRACQHRCRDLATQSTLPVNDSWSSGERLIICGSVEPIILGVGYESCCMCHAQGVEARKGRHDLGKSFKFRNIIPWKPTPWLGLCRVSMVRDTGGANSRRHGSP
jgi:hypothetical protein